MVEIDKLYIELKVLLDDITFGYGLSTEEFRHKSIQAKNRLNEIIETVFKYRYLEDVFDAGLPTVSPNNIKYIKCVCCGEIKNTTAFVTYGGVNEKRSQGLCRICDNLMIRGDLNEEDIRKYNDYRNHNDNIISICR